MRLGFCGWVVGFGLLAVLAGCTDEQAPTCAQVDFDIGADQYLNNRFFALDDPTDEAMGRRNGERIQFSSLLVFRRVASGPILPDDITNVAGYIDRNGYRDWPNLDFLDPFIAGAIWRPVTDFDPMVDDEGTLVALTCAVSKPLTPFWRWSTTSKTVTVKSSVGWATIRNSGRPCRNCPTSRASTGA